MVTVTPLHYALYFRVIFIFCTLRQHAFHVADLFFSPSWFLQLHVYDKKTCPDREHTRLPLLHSWCIMQRDGIRNCAFLFFSGLQAFGNSSEPRDPCVLNNEVPRLSWRAPRTNTWRAAASRCQFLICLSTSVGTLHLSSLWNAGVEERTLPGNVYFHGNPVSSCAGWEMSSVLIKKTLQAMSHFHGLTWFYSNN